MLISKTNYSGRSYSLTVNNRANNVVRTGIEKIRQFDQMHPEVRIELEKIVLDIIIEFLVQKKDRLDRTMPYSSVERDTDYNPK